MSLLVSDVQNKLSNCKSRLKINVLCSVLLSWTSRRLCDCSLPWELSQTQVVMLYFGLWGAAHCLPSPLTATTEVPLVQNSTYRGLQWNKRVRDPWMWQTHTHKNSLDKQGCLNLWLASWCLSPHTARKELLPFVFSICANFLYGYCPGLNCKYVINLCSREIVLINDGSETGSQRFFFFGFF